MLGLNRRDYLPLKDIEAHTANGRVYRQMTAVEINFKGWPRGIYGGFEDLAMPDEPAIPVKSGYPDASFRHKS